MGFAGVYYVASRGVQVDVADFDKLLFILTEAIAGNAWLAITVGGALAAGISTVAGLLMIMGNWYRA